MSRKNWDRFFPPTLGDTAPKQGPGLFRWLLATFFVVVVTGAVVVVKVHKPEEPTLAPSDPTATAENSDVLEAPKPLDDVPIVEVKPEPTAPVPVPVTDVPPGAPIPPAPSSAAPPTVSDVAPTARLMPPEQPKAVEAMTVSHQVARPRNAEDGPESAGADKLHYAVKGADETLWEIAKKQLGGGERWMEISRLNPDVDAKQPVPAGTVLRMPSEAQRPEEPFASAPPSYDSRAAAEAAARVALAATGALAALPALCQAADNRPPAPEPQRATLVDAQPAPPTAEPPQARHNEGSTPPVAEARPTPPAEPAPPVAGQPPQLRSDPAPFAPTVVPLVSTREPQTFVSAPQPAPPSPSAPTALPPNGPPPAGDVPNPPATAVLRQAPLPLPELLPTVPKTQVEAPAAPLPITGTFLCDVVNHTTVKLPARLQQQTDKTAVLYVALGPDQQSVWVYTPAALERLSEQLERLPGGDDRVRRCRRLCFSRMETVEVNHALGCVVLPPELAQAAGLLDKAVLIGARDHYELWDAQRWQHYCEPAAAP